MRVPGTRLLWALLCGALLASQLAGSAAPAAPLDQSCNPRPPVGVVTQVIAVGQLQATISKEGNISNVKVLAGNAQLARAAVDAVKQWKYKPYYLNNEPVEIQTQIIVNFKLP